MYSAPSSLVLKIKFIMEWTPKRIKVKAIIATVKKPNQLIWLAARLRGGGRNDRSSPMQSTPFTNSQILLRLLNIPSSLINWFVNRFVRKDSSDWLTFLGRSILTSPQIIKIIRSKTVIQSWLLVMCSWKSKCLTGIAWIGSNNDS